MDVLKDGHGIRKGGGRTRLIGKLLALPFVIVAGILYLFCKFLVVVSGAVLGILPGIVFLAALMLFFAAGFWPEMSWLVIAFLISTRAVTCRNEKTRN